MVPGTIGRMLPAAAAANRPTYAVAPMTRWIVVSSVLLTLALAVVIYALARALSANDEPDAGASASSPVSPPPTAAPKPTPPTSIPSSLRAEAARTAGTWKFNETAARNAVLSLLMWETGFLLETRIDTDHDGHGEAGGLLDLSGAIAGRRASPLDPPLLSAEYRTLDANGECGIGGYRIRVFLPGKRGVAVPEPAKGFRAEDLDPDLCETTWCAYAWPDRLHETGNRTFFVNSAGEVLSTEGPYSGSGKGPRADAAFKAPGPITGEVAVDARGSDGLFWRRETP